MGTDIGAKLAQEMAMRGQDPPSRYILSEDKFPIGTSLAPDTIPVVDLSRLSRSSCGVDESAKLLSAAESWGLFIAAGHEMLNATKEFFALPVEERQRYTNLKGGERFQYEGYGSDNVVSDEQTLDWCDRLYLLVHPEDKRDLSLWPDEPTNFREILHEFTIKTKEVGDYILRFIAKQLELIEDFFADQLLDSEAEIAARFTYYPHCTRPDTVYSIKPHSDGSIITILLLDYNVGGLQVEKDNEWVDVPTVPNSLLIIFGDHMEMISNGIIRSPLHRVVTNTRGDRVSVAMFYSPGREKELQPADALVTEERPALYRKVKTRDYATAWVDIFARGGRTVDLFKVDLDHLLF